MFQYNISMMEHLATSLFIFIYPVFVVLRRYFEMELVDTHFSYVCNTTFSSRLFIKRSRVTIQNNSTKIEKSNSTAKNDMRV